MTTDGLPHQTAAEACARAHRASPINPSERECLWGNLRSTRGGCASQFFGQADQEFVTNGQADEGFVKGFVTIPPAHEVARDCNSTAGMQGLYRRFARLVPERFMGTSNVSALAAEAYEQWRSGSYRPKAPR
jgi:hypothetical protein